MKWSAVYEASLCTFVLRSETMIWPGMGFDISLQNFKKRLVDIFSPQIERKMFRRVFSYNFGCRKKTLSDFLALSSCLQKINNGKPAKSFQLQLKDLGFLENFCLCKCFTELYFFYWLLVVSCNFNRFAVCFQSFINIACRSTQNAARIKCFLDYASF